MKFINLNRLFRYSALIVLVLGTSLLISSCDKLDFVDPNGPSLQQTTVQTLVTGIEASMRLDYEFYIRDVSVIGREAYYLEPADPRYTGTLMGKDGTQIDPSGFLLNRTWTARYRVIRNCNILMEQYSANDVNGFAKTIVAYQLLLNLNLTYNNGIKVNVAGDTPGPFVSKDEALTYIAGLLDDAKADLSSASSFSFHLSNGFSDFSTPAEFLKFNRGLRARVAIYQKDYNTALTALGESFLDLGASLKKGVYLDYGTGSGDMLNPIYEVPDASNIKFFAHPTFVTDAEAGDARVAAKTFKRSSPTTLDGLTADLAQTVSASTVDPFPIMRNEELILLRAEANVGLGNYSAAETDVNFIRNSAGLANVTLDASNALDEVLKQKRYSLFLEGFRWIDLRLYDKLDTLPLDRPGDVVHVQMPRPTDEL